MDFSAFQMHKVEYLNKDSEGTATGEQKDKKSTILP